MTARALLLLALALGACQRPADGPGLDGPGLSGTLRLAVADGLAEAAGDVADRFERPYPAADVALVPTSARGALVALQSGAADAALLDRAPTDAERAALAAAGRSVTETLLGAGAVAVVVGEGSALTGVSTSELVELAAAGRLVVASRNAGATGAALATLGDPDAVRDVPSAADVLAAVGADPEAVGLVALADVAGAARVLPVGGVAPTPRAVFEGRYPLAQPAVLLTVASDASTRALAAGFARFAASATGQEAVLRAGLAPATLPQREVVLQ